MSNLFELVLLGSIQTVLSVFFGSCVCGVKVLQMSVPMVNLVLGV